MTHPNPFHACEPALADRPPAGPAWMHEVKWDGYRVIARKDGDRVRLWRAPRPIIPARSRASEKLSPRCRSTAPCLTARPSCCGEITAPILTACALARSGSGDLGCL